MEVLATVSLWQLGKQYLIIGTVAFGPAVVAEMKRRLVDGRQWLSKENFFNGMALAQMLPGATFVSLAVFGGYQIRGIVGALVSFITFISPSFLVMVFLSYIYVTYSSLSAVSILFQGVTIVVVGLISQAVLVIGKSVLTDYKGGFIALAATAIMFIYPNVFLLLFFAAAAGIVLYNQSLERQIAVATDVPANNGISWRSWLCLLLLFLTGTAYLVYGPPILRQLGWVFFRMGAVLFGGGLSMIPFIQQEVVGYYHWLTVDEFLVGIALGQVTPGPITILAAFVGYKAAAVSGAVAATLGIYLPSLFLVTATAKIHQKVRHIIWVKAAIQGMISAFAGMMIFVVIEMAQHALHDFNAVLLAAGVFFALQFGKLEPIWVVLGGTLVYWVTHVLF
ncbi:MAG: chromate efflux transporter [Pelosinus sp.]|nr:chromate efflux transporter [Pelosinus sp.]